MHERVHRLRRGLEDIDQALVGPHFEMLAALLVDVRRAQHANPIDLGRQRNGAADERAGALGRIDDALGGLIEDRVIVGFQPDTNFLLRHDVVMLSV